MNERLTTAVYPAILSRAEDGITITFPDLPGCISCAQTDAEAIFMARDALGAWGVAAEDLGEPVPSPTAVTALRPEPNETVCLVDAWIPTFREERRGIRERQAAGDSVKEMARKLKLSCSRVYKALKEFPDPAAAQITIPEVAGMAQV